MIKNKNQNTNLVQKILLKISELFICYTDDKNLIKKLNSSKRIFLHKWLFSKYKLLQSNGELISRLSNDPKFKFDITNKSKKIAVVHVRRKDYLNISEELDISYYENALAFKKTENNIQFDVYTDDIL